MGAVGLRLGMGLCAFALAHVIAAIAWIGGSFFFMHLDACLRKKTGAMRRLKGHPGRSMGAASMR